MGCACVVNQKDRTNQELNQFWEHMQIRSKNSIDMYALFRVKGQNKAEISEEKWESIINSILSNNTTEKCQKISTEFWLNQVKRAKETKREHYLILSILFLSNSTEDIFIMNFIKTCKTLCGIDINEDNIEKDALIGLLRYYFEMLTDPYISDQISTEQVDIFDKEKKEMGNIAEGIELLINELCNPKQTDGKFININSFLTTNYTLLRNDAKIRSLIMYNDSNNLSTDVTN